MLRIDFRLIGDKVGRLVRVFPIVAPLLIGPLVSFELGVAGVLGLIEIRGQIQRGSFSLNTASHWLVFTSVAFVGVCFCGVLTRGYWRALRRHNLERLLR